MAPAAFANCIVWVDLRQTSTPWYVDRELPSSPFYDAVKFSLFIVNKNCTVSVGEPNVVLFYETPGDGIRSYCNELIVSDELGYRSPVAFKAGSVKYERVFTAKIASQGCVLSQQMKGQASRIKLAMHRAMCLKD